jgi:hypothetical protein
VPAETRGAFEPSNAAQPAKGIGELDWQRSSFCGQHGSCVEVAEMRDGGVAVRHGEAADMSDVLFFNRDEWDAFVVGVKAGEFG